MSYPSDVRDQEWDRIKDLFKPAHPGRPHRYEMRRIYNALFDPLYCNKVKKY
jgi:transposase